MFIGRRHLGGELAADPLGFLTHENAHPIAKRTQRGGASSSPPTNNGYVKRRFLTERYGAD
jgi:hypothetical protein